jgi:putative tryptophan/tyrosine transport system substrate-binding protein
MDRRAFLGALGMLAVPLGVAAQEARRLYRIGVLSPEKPPPGLLEGFKERLRELGYVEGKTFALESRNAEGSNERLSTLADDLVRSKVDAIVAINTPAAHAAKKATTTIPIVITRVADPVKSGLVASLSHPGGNITGITFLPDELASKRLQLLKEAIRGIARVAVLWARNNPGSDLSVTAMDGASAQLGLKLVRIPVTGPGELPGAFQAAIRERAEAVIVVDDAFITQHRRVIVDLASKQSLPVSSLFPPVAEAGGFIAYGPNTAVLYRRAADYVDRILKGAAPRALPIEQPTKFELVINLKTAKALGLTIPPALLQRADQVIE